jgi:hypothetical protein
MSSPDDKAAAFNPKITTVPPIATVGDLTTAHLGCIISTCGIVGELIDVSPDATGGVRLTVKEDARPFDTVFGADPRMSCEMFEGEPVAVTDVVDMRDFYAKARELDRVSKAIRDNETANEKLRELKAKLSDELLGTFAQVGQSTLPFDSRRAYIHTTIVPEFETKPDGTKYKLADLVDDFKKLGREDQVTKETVNYMTLQGVLREIRNGAFPMPPELAAKVRIGERAEVRVGVGAKPKR